jgi:penicillin-binding protein 1A
MVPMFCTFGNKGVTIKPLLVTHIRDRNGNLLATFTPERTEIYNERTAYLMVNLLEGVINRGTSIRLRFRYGFKNEIYGKTGTTQNQSDGWFFGVVPDLATGIWVGGEDRSIHFKGIRLGQGANMALPIWAKYMQKVYADSTLNISPNKTFEKPENINVELDCSKLNNSTNSTIDYGLD